MSGIGKILKSERERKALTIDDIAKKTHNNERILAALETGDFQEIPGKFYIINFLRGYLKAIGLDEKEFFHTHKSIISQITSGSENDPRQYYSKLRYSRFKRRNLILIILVLLIVTALIYFLFISRSSAISQLIYPAKTRQPIPATAMALDLQPRHWSPDIIPVRVDVSFESDCWVQIFRGSRKISEQVFKAGDRHQVKGYDLILLIGNPSAVNLWVNKKSITKFKRQTRPLRLVLNPELAAGLE